MNNDEEHKDAIIKTVGESMLSCISHELRTPLNIIISYASLLIECCSLSRDIKEDKYRKYGIAILESGERLLCHINNILEIAQSDVSSESMDIDVIDISTILNEVIENSFDGTALKGIAIYRKYDPDVKAMGCYSGIKRAMLEVISNSIRFTEKHGWIEVCLDVKQECVLISIRDSGSGICRDDFLNVFEAFYQSNHDLDRGFDGLGIGLTIAKRFIEASGGKIEILNSSNNGTAIIITLRVE